MSSTTSLIIIVFAMYALRQSTDLPTAHRTPFSQRITSNKAFKCHTRKNSMRCVMCIPAQSSQCALCIHLYSFHLTLVHSLCIFFSFGYFNLRPFAHTYAVCCTMNALTRHSPDIQVWFIHFRSMANEYRSEESGKGTVAHTQTTARMLCTNMDPANKIPLVSSLSPFLRNPLYVHTVACLSILYENIRFIRRGERRRRV